MPVVACYGRQEQERKERKKTEGKGTKSEKKRKLAEEEEGDFSGAENVRVGDFRRGRERGSKTGKEPAADSLKEKEKVWLP